MRWKTKPRPDQATFLGEMEDQARAMQPLEMDGDQDCSPSLAYSKAPSSSREAMQADQQPPSLRSITARSPFLPLLPTGGTPSAKH